MSFAQNLKDYFFSSNACRSNKENSSTQANQPMKKRLLAPITQRIIGKYNSNPSQQTLDTSCVSLNIVGQEIKDLGLNRRLNAHKVKKSLAFDKDACLSKRESKENEMIIEDSANLAPPKSTNVLGPLNRNLNKEAALPEVTKAPIMWNIKPKGPEFKEFPPMSRSDSMLMKENSLPPLAQGGSKMSLEDNSTKVTEVSQQNISLSDLKLNSNLMVCDYVDDIIKTLKEKDVDLSLQNCLENHKISPSLRAKMVDWMIEVLCSYKCADQTFFLAISVMDSFFKRSTVAHSSNDLHLVGVASMFIASKFEEIYPMRLSVLYEKVGHKKLSIEDIIRKESEIIQVLNFNIISATIHEFITNVLFQLGLKNVMNPELYAYLQRVCVYLSKANMYDYELLSQYKTYELAACTLFVAFKVTEQVDNSFPLTNMVEEVCQILGVKDDVLYSCATKILALAKNFDKVFPSFKNLKKFHSIGTPEINVPLSERRTTSESTSSV